MHRQESSGQYLVQYVGLRAGVFHFNFSPPCMNPLHSSVACSCGPRWSLRAIDPTLRVQDVTVRTNRGQIPQEAQLYLTTQWLSPVLMCARTPHRGCYGKTLRIALRFRPLYLLYCYKLTYCGCNFTVVLCCVLKMMGAFVVWRIEGHQANKAVLAMTKKCSCGGSVVYFGRIHIF